METNKFGNSQSIDDMSNEELPKTIKEFDEWLEGTERMKSLYNELSDLDIEPKSDLHNVTVEMNFDSNNANGGDAKDKIRRSERIVTVIGKILKLQIKEQDKWSKRILNQPKE